jgi:hypothetical protein
MVLFFAQAADTLPVHSCLQKTCCLHALRVINYCMYNIQKGLGLTG